MSKLYFRYGAMNSGKSTNLLQVAYNYEERGMKVLLLKPKTDEKGGDRLVSRLGVSRKVDVLISVEDNILDIINTYQETKQKIDVILFDEVQFITSKQVDQLFEIVITLNIPVICYGLRTDFKMQGFEGSTRLLTLAHSIEEMVTICKCGKKAVLNSRKINGDFTFEGSQVVIDNNDSVEYESLCGKCYFKHRINANILKRYARK